MGRFELKSQCFATKKEGHFQIGEQGYVPFFPVSEDVIAEVFYFLFSWTHTEVLKRWKLSTTQVQ